jgi:hypothetical protein
MQASWKISFVVLSVTLGWSLTYPLEIKCTFFVKCATGNGVGNVNWKRMTDLADQKNIPPRRKRPRSMSCFVAERHLSNQMMEDATRSLAVNVEACGVGGVKLRFRGSSLIPTLMIRTEEERKSNVHCGKILTSLLFLFQLLLLFLFFHLLQLFQLFPRGMLMEEDCFQTTTNVLHFYEMEILATTLVPTEDNCARSTLTETNEIACDKRFEKKGNEPGNPCKHFLYSYKSGHEG